MAGGWITPEQLRRIARDKEREKARRLLEQKRKEDEERRRSYQEFLARDAHPEVFVSVFQVVQIAAEQGEREVLAVRFPSAYCTDGGRAINNVEAGWHETLTGFARRAYEFWGRELKPHGYGLRAQIMDFPGGVLGDVGMFLRW